MPTRRGGARPHRPPTGGPAVKFLQRQDDTQNRVEAVATWGHWEAYYLARAGFPLARGWFRQDDFPENRVLYDHNLTAPRYDHWLRLLGVRFVVLPDTTLDYSSRGRGPPAALGPLGPDGWSARSAHLSIYELPDSVPIVSAPAGAHAPADPARPSSGIDFYASEPGRYVVRMRYTPYWEVHGRRAGVRFCGARRDDRGAHPGGGAHRARPGPVAETVGDAVTGTSSGCRAAAS